ncbi:MAG: hypothetical protein ACKVWR_21325 [Acidimicrobiales bacterium]
MRSSDDGGRDDETTAGAPVDGPDGPHGLVEEAAAARFAAEARIDDAVARRRRERWLRAAAQEEATFADLCADLAESAAVVTVRTAAGGAHHGVVVQAGADCMTIRSAGRLVTVALRAVTAIAGAATGSPEAPQGRRPGLEAAGSGGPGAFAAALGAHAGARATLRLVTDDGEAFLGELEALGQDVATLRPEGRRDRVIYVRLASVAEFSVAESG